MRGFSSRIPTPGMTSTTTPSTSSTASITKSKKDSSHNIASKFVRPTDIGGSLSGLVRPTSVVKQKLSQMTKSSLSNLTSRIIARQFSANNNINSNNNERKEEKQNEIPTSHVVDDQMLIDETIDLVGSDDNVNRFGSCDITMSKENIAPIPPSQQQQPLPPSSQTTQPSNATFDLCRRDGTFIKSPSHSAAVGIVGSVNSLPDATKESRNLTTTIISKSRDSLNALGNQTRIIGLRKSGNDFLGSTLSLTKSPEWASEDMLNATAEVFNSTMMNNRLVEVTPCRPFMNISTDAHLNATQMLCMTPNVDNTTIVAKNDLAMDVDECDAQVAMRAHDVNIIDPQKRFSFGLDITECTLDCSIDLCETFSSAVHQEKVGASPMEKQMSLDVDESLGILTPDQMKEFLDSTNTNHTNNNNLDLQLIPNHKLSQQSRIDQTPSPEELPLDPVGVKMEETMMQPNQQLITSQQEVSTAESDPKTEMTKSVTSKVSNSIITSITSITSLDTGYIGDGEMSRPASRGAADQSPSKAPRNQILANPLPPLAAAVHRPRQDPMTDSDFFTESDADDIFHQREKQRRAQVIDGHLYGVQGANNVILQQQNQESDSCMESSGVFTDNENRGDDYLLNRIAENAREHQVNDMSPDLSSDTITSSGTTYSQKKPQITSSPTQHIDRPREFLNETSSSICSVIDGCTNTTVTTAATCDVVNLISSDSFTSSNTSHEGDNDVSVKKVTTSASKKLGGSSRKTHKNETNLGLKKQEMSSTKIVGGTKKSLNGKWEPVMNKIAENKNIKKRFDNVKSKVTCGVVKKNMIIKTSSSEDQTAHSTESTGAISKNNNSGGENLKR